MVEVRPAEGGEMSWRPDNWKKYYGWVVLPIPEQNAYEAGADAMYPFALKKGKAEGRAELLDELRAIKEIEEL